MKFDGDGDKDGRVVFRDGGTVHATVFGMPSRSNRVILVYGASGPGQIASLEEDEA